MLAVDLNAVRGPRVLASSALRIRTLPELAGTHLPGPASDLPDQNKWARAQKSVLTSLPGGSSC